MTEAGNHKTSTPTIGIYSPSLQGLYVGEILNQIRQLCVLKGYRLVIIRSGGYGQFENDIHLTGLDGIILIRNAIAPRLAERIAEEKIPCVCIAYDYFPIKIPMVSVDNAFGMGLAFEHLIKNGHQRIAFVGDLSQYDLRKRYEAYCDLHEEHQWPIQEAYLFPVNNTLFSGGQEAAQAFINQNCDASAIVFGAGLTAIGFVQYLKAQKLSNPHPDYVCFDALPLIPVLAPEIACVDLNFNLIAYRCLNVLESSFEGEAPLEPTLVQPKFAFIDPNNKTSHDPFLAACVDLPELQNPSYMKALLASLHDWPREVIESDLKQLMSLTPVFSKYLQMVFLSRYLADSSGKAWLKHIQTFTQQGTHNVALNDSNSASPPARFPPPSIAECTRNLPNASNICCHFPIQLQNRTWGFFSVYGWDDLTNTASSFLGFGGYMEQIVNLYENQLTIKKLQHQNRAEPSQASNTPEPSVDPEATIEWAQESNTTFWSERALAMLNFTSPVERNIYQHMELTDRMHPGDIDFMRNAVSRCLNDNCITAVARIKPKSGAYLQVTFAGEPSRDEQNRITGIRYCIGVDEHDA